MIILGIETSCDETAAAIVEDGRILHAQAVASSQELHAKYGGIIPDKAAREQLKSIIPVLSDVCSQFGTDREKGEGIDAIAVTVGPGLIGSLLVGVETAKSLAMVWGKQLIPVNHLVGHIYANWIMENRTSLPLALSSSPPNFPALVLLVSGGHSDIILMKGHGSFELLGSTRDDAGGECLDKCGRFIGLPYPYGPFIQDLADKDRGEMKITLPRPLFNSGDFDFSFSGLKTGFLNALHNNENSIPSRILFPALAHELQEALTDCLVDKAIAACRKYQPSSIALAGGVAANKRLREKLVLSADLLPGRPKVHIPPVKLCTDNAIYIAGAAYFNKSSRSIEKVDADPSLTVDSKFTAP